MVQPPAKRFWKADFNGVVVATETSRMAAFEKAAQHVMELPQEVTA